MLENASLYTSAPTRVQTPPTIGRTAPENDLRPPVPPTQPEPAPQTDSDRNVRQGDRVTTLGRSTLVDANGLIVLQEQNGGDPAENRAGRNRFTGQGNSGDDDGSTGGRATANGGDTAAANGGKSDVGTSGGATSGANSSELTEEEENQVRDLKARDTVVRAHEQAHATVGGAYASAPQYEFEQGPDGRSYAVGGHVSISTSPVDGDPEATIDKMAVVRRAALAPAEPSGADLRVAAQADQTAQAARSQLREQQTEQTREQLGISDEKAPATDTSSAERQAGLNGTPNATPNTGGATPTFAEGRDQAETDSLLGEAATAPGLVDDAENGSQVAAPTANQLLGQIGGLDLGQVGNGVRNFVGQASSFVASLIESGAPDAGSRAGAVAAQAGDDQANGTGQATRAAAGSGRAGGEQPGSINLTI